MPQKGKITLSEVDKQKLATIVKKMEAGKEPTKNIQAVVDYFTKQHGQPEVVKKKAGGNPLPTGSSQLESTSPSESKTAPATETSQTQQPNQQKPSIFDNYKDDPDPVKAAITPFQKQHNDLLQRNISADQTFVKKPAMVGGANGKEYLQHDGERELAESKNNIEAIKASAFPNAATARKYLNQVLIKKGAQLHAKQKPLDINKLELPGEGNQPQKVDPTNLDHFDINEIGANIDKSNLTETLAWDSYQRERNLDDTLEGAGNFDDKLIHYAATQDKNLASHLNKLNKTGSPSVDLPNVYAGELVAKELNNPLLIQKAKADPNVAKEYKYVAEHFYDKYPEYAAKVVSQVISQERENRGYNNWFVNIPSQGGTDELVETLIKEGKLHPQDKAIYEKYIRPYVGVMNSIGRGIGKSIPGVNATINDSPISTPGLLETTQDTFQGSLRGMASSAEDILHEADIDVQSDQTKLYNKLKNDHSLIGVDPKGMFHTLSQATGHVVGFVAPMILGGAATKALTGDALTSELVTNILMFEGKNHDDARVLFPDDVNKQGWYTMVATGIDAGLTKLIPNKEAEKAAREEFKPMLNKMVGELATGKITEAEARRTILDKIAGVAGNQAKVGLAMAGFGLVHNTLDAVSGARDVKSEDVIHQFLSDFKTGSLGSFPISLAARSGKNTKLTAEVVWNAAQSPEQWRNIIEERSKMNEDVAKNKVEYLQNLTDASAVYNDLKDKKHLTDDQKKKFLMLGLVKKINERKAATSADEIIKKDYEENAKEAKKDQEAVYKGEDDAKEYKSWVSVIKPEDNKHPETTEIKPGENTPDQKSKGAKVILPQSNKAPEVVETKKEEPVERTPEEAKKLLDEEIPKEKESEDVMVKKFGKEEKEPLSAKVAKTVLKRRHEKLEQIINGCLTKQA